MSAEDETESHALVANPEREGQMLVKTAGLTATELRTVQRALESPPQKADVFAFLASGFSSLVVIIKIATDVLARDPTVPTPMECALVAAGVVIITVVGVRYQNARNAVSSFHSDALDYVKQLMRAAAATTTAPPLAPLPQLPAKAGSMETHSTDAASPAPVPIATVPPQDDEHA